MVWVPLIAKGPLRPGMLDPGAITNENVASILELMVDFTKRCPLASSHVVASATWVPLIAIPWSPVIGSVVVLPVIWPNFERSMVMSIGVLMVVSTTAVCVPLL